MTAPPARTLLFSLPNELLEDIVEHVLADYPKRPIALALTCRRLGALVRSRIFRRVHCGGDVRRETGSLIQQAFQANPSARNLVRDMLYLPRYDFGTGECVLVGDPELPSIFSIFPAVRAFELACTRSAGVASLLTGPPTPNDGKLRRLEISYEIISREDDAYIRHAGWWNLLLRFTSLDDLAIVAESGYEGDDCVAFETAQLLPLQSVRKFTISAPMFPINGLPLSALLPHLEVLTVKMNCRLDEAELCTRLVRTAPSSLAQLNVHAHSVQSLSISDLVDALTDRPTLRHLSLPGAVLAADYAFGYLSSSSLRSLTVTSSRPFDDVLLLRLVRGKNRMKSLEVLRLDHFGPPGHVPMRRSLAEKLARAETATLAAALESVYSYESPRWPDGSTPTG